MKYLIAAVYVGLVVLANWLASAYFWTVPFTTLVAPAGVFCVGAVLVLRDWAQALYGLRWTLPLIPLAGGVSWLAGTLAGWTTLQRVALASVCAFVVSETVEALVFTPLRRRSLTLGVALSATVGNLIDSALFLWLAFGSLTFLRGQVVGKGEMIALGVALTALRRRAWQPAST